MDEYIVIRYHHGGVLIRDDEGVLTYANGKVVDLPEIDADFVNLRDLDTLFKGYGYETCKQMLWLMPNAMDLDVGLRPLSTASDIVEMVKAALSNGNFIEIYFEDCIATPDIIAPAPVEGSDRDEDNQRESFGSGSDHISSGDKDDSGNGDEFSTDSDDSVEDEPYKPPPPGYEDETESEKELECIGEDTIEEEEKQISFKEDGYGYNSEELNTPPSSGAEEAERVGNPKFNVDEVFGHVHLELGMKFVSLQHFKNAIKDYNISLGRQFKYFRNKKESRDWVANKLEKRLMTQSNMTRAEAYEHMKEEYKVHVHLKKVTKALHKAKARIEGCEKEQYAKLRDYLGELLRSNPGSTCQMQGPIRAPCFLPGTNKVLEQFVRDQNGPRVLA
ncbi:uncharacterized protein LOC133294796 [Gastrolobium bilobum]|uniref:uncharacterized protein LOC133294796 n=1 Tax=Gastrolobium bilobum TaxID=150636 RepID=UPI002AB0EDC6|nr:uncharacterized protein LOC133294796 [Gastrolobium bilobum]